MKYTKDSDRINVCVKMFDGLEIRIVDVNGDPWFIANDVASVLGYEKPRNAVSKYCKHSEYLKGSTARLFTTSPRGIKIIPEGDVFAMIRSAASNSVNPIIKAKAEKFNYWVDFEVLPSLRKKGVYSFDDVFDKLVVDKEEITIPESCKVYVIQEGEDGPIKIGVSRDVDARLKQLQTGNSKELKVLAVIDTDDAYQAESMYHKELASHNIRGEWFDKECLNKIQ